MRGLFSSVSPNFYRNVSWLENIEIIIYSGPSPIPNTKRCNNKWLSEFTVNGCNLKCKFCQNVKIFQWRTTNSAWFPYGLQNCCWWCFCCFMYKTIDTRLLVQTFVFSFFVFNWIIKWFQVAFRMEIRYGRLQVANNLLFVILFFLLINIEYFIINSKWS